MRDLSRGGLLEERLDSIKAISFLDEGAMHRTAIFEYLGGIVDPYRRLGHVYSLVATAIIILWRDPLLKMFILNM